MGQSHEVAKAELTFATGLDPVGPEDLSQLDPGFSGSSGHSMALCGNGDGYCSPPADPGHDL